MMRSTRTLTIETLAGPKEILAPAGWVYDKTATVVWTRLLHLTRRGYEPFKTKRERDVWEGQISILSLMLANALGMASPYWERRAFEIVTAERASNA